MLRRIVRPAAVAFGSAGVALALLDALVPGPLAPTRAALGSSPGAPGPTAATAVLGVGLVLYAAVAARRGAAEPADRPLAPSAPAPEVARTDEALVGEGFDESYWALRRAVTDRRVPFEESLDGLRGVLREVARDLLVASTGDPPDACRERVATGEWTDDPIAGAFLGDDRAPAVPIRGRMWAWLAPGRELDRRLDRTLDALDALAADLDGVDPRPVRRFERGTLSDEPAGSTGAGEPTDGAGATDSDGSSVPTEGVGSPGGGSPATGPADADATEAVGPW
ncbi:hypothetical protein ACFQPA_02750 [Halomarina halobia]|uniref:DUF4129 domain-containing protein n=1 Tax=Halomarina halobia TaxID=3033386 RepID=A0ABD6A5F3_9EURY|nr:hypothetical protein [Halomarina sp. PSR21]